MLMTFNPAINGWAIFSEASLTACRVMAKRLRDVCALPESEPLWRAGRGFDNSPAIYGWDSSPANIQSPVRDERSLRTATMLAAVPRGTRQFAGQFTQP